MANRALSVRVNRNAAGWAHCLLKGPTKGQYRCWQAQRRRASPGGEPRPWAPCWRGWWQRERRWATCWLTLVMPTGWQITRPCRCGPWAPGWSWTCTPTIEATRAPTAGLYVTNGSLFCPAVPKALLGLVPPGRDASAAQLVEHDKKSAELGHYKFSRTSASDQDGYHQATCPALTIKLRCPLRPASMALGYDRPSVLAPPEHTHLFCPQRTITVPPAANAKTAQKHDYPSAAWRKSYARRTAAERSYSTIKDPATNDVCRGWCRTMGLAPMFIFITCCLVARNFRVLGAFQARQAEQARRVAAGLPPKHRHRRRRTLGDLVGPAP